MFLRCRLPSVIRQKRRALLSWVHNIKVMWLRLALSNGHNWLGIIPIFYLRTEPHPLSRISTRDCCDMIRQHKIWLEQCNAAAVAGAPEVVLQQKSITFCCEWCPLVKPTVTHVIYQFQDIHGVSVTILTVN